MLFRHTIPAVLPEQLLDLGLSAPAVRHRAGIGLLHRVHAGVYAVGYPRLTRKGRYMAAVLACGLEDCGLSHRAAADARALRPSSRSTIDVISPRRPGRLAICRGAGLPRPAVNAWIPIEPLGYEADFLWHERGLIVEVDGRNVHATRRAFEHDRRRDQRLMLAGYRVVRFTWRQVEREPRAVAASVRALLAQAAWA